MRRISRHLTKAFILSALLIFAATVAYTLTIGSDFKPSTPLMRQVDPSQVKAGQLVTVFGDALDKAKVDEVFLTSRGEDYKLEIIEQTERSLLLRIPAKIPVGRYSFMVKMTVHELLIEQPLYLDIVLERDPGPTS